MSRSHARPVAAPLRLLGLCAASLTALAGCSSAPTIPSTPPAPPPASPQPTAMAPGWPVSLQCGPRLFQVAPRGDSLQLGGEGLALVLEPVPSASGQKLVATAQPTTSVWLREDHARVVLAGEALPECRILGRGAP